MSRDDDLAYMYLNLLKNDGAMRILSYLYKKKAGASISRIMREAKVTTNYRIMKENINILENLGLVTVTPSQIKTFGRRALIVELTTLGYAYMDLVKSFIAQIKDMLLSFKIGNR